MDDRFRIYRETLSRFSCAASRIIEGFLIISILAAIYLMVALVTMLTQLIHHGHKTAWDGVVQNKAGALGALVADTFFFSFGSLAYVFPALIVLLGTYLFRRRSKSLSHDYMVYGTRILGLLLLLLTSCGLCRFKIFDDIWYFSSGGVVGDVVSNISMPLLKCTGYDLSIDGDLGYWFYAIYRCFVDIRLQILLVRRPFHRFTWFLNKFRSDKHEVMRPFATEIPDESEMPYIAQLDEFDAEDDPLYYLSLYSDRFLARQKKKTSHHLIRLCVQTLQTHETL